MIIKVEANILNFAGNGYEPNRVVQEFEDQDAMPGVPAKGDVIKMSIKGRHRTMIVYGRTWAPDAGMVLLDCSEVQG